MEWVGTLCVVALLLVGLVAVGVRVPGAELARAVASRMLCAASLADGCGDEPGLIAAYGTEVGELVREHMPMLAFEEGSRAVPVDFRRCRSTAVAMAPSAGWCTAPMRGLPVTAFVHVVDCRAGGGGAARSRGRRLLGLARRQPLHPVLDLLRRLGDPARHPDRRRRGLPPRRLGGGADPHPARRPASTSGPPPTTATTTRAAPPTGARTPASTRSRTPPKRSAPAPSNGWGPRPGPAARLRRQPRRQRRRHPPRRPLHPRPPRPPDPARADRRQRRLDLRDHPALAQEGLARPRGRGHRLARRESLCPS